MTKTHNVLQGHGCHHHKVAEGSSKVDGSNVAGRVRVSPHPMISVATAQDTVLTNCVLGDVVEKSFMDPEAMVLAEDVEAKDPLPPFPASIKDGYG